MKVINTLAKIFDRAIDILVMISLGLVIFMVATITYDVAGRFFFNSPLIWESEINENVMLFMTFLGAAWVLKHDGHVNVELVVSRLRGNTKETFTLINCIIGAIACLIIAYYGIQLTYLDAVAGMHKPTVLRIPNVFILWVIPLGFLMLAFEFIRKSCTQIQKLKGAELVRQPAVAEEIGIGGTNIG